MGDFHASRDTGVSCVAERQTESTALRVCIETLPYPRQRRPPPASINVQIEHHKTTTKKAHTHMYARAHGRLLAGGSKQRALRAITSFSFNSQKFANKSREVSPERALARYVWWNPKPRPRTTCARRQISKGRALHS